MHVQTLPLREIDKVELHSSNLALVLHLEVEPLMVTAGVGVDAHVAVKLTWLNLNDHIQVAGFKRRVKQEVGVIWPGYVLQRLHRPL